MVIVLAATVAVLILKPPRLIDIDDISGYINLVQTVGVGIGLVAVMLYQLWRSARAAKQCRERRSFDTMAVAVRAQRLFWMLLAVGLACTALFLVAMGMAMQPRIKTVKEMIRKSQEENALRQPARTP